MCLCTAGSRRLGNATSNASIACRPAGNSSCSLRAVFIPQVPSSDISLFTLALVPNSSFGEISRIRHKSRMRVDTTPFVPVSYFCICWNVRRRAWPTAPWLKSQLHTPHPDNRADFLINDTITPALHPMSLLILVKQALQHRPFFIRPNKKLQPGWRDKIALADIKDEPGGSLAHIQRECSTRSQATTHQVTSRVRQINADFTRGPTGG